MAFSFYKFSLGLLQELRMTREHGSVSRTGVWYSREVSLDRRVIKCAAYSPMNSAGAWMVVSGGLEKPATFMSSNPTTDTSSGTLYPFS